MKYFKVAVIVLGLAMGAVSASEARYQQPTPGTGGVPSGVILKDPTESNLSITLSMARSSYIQGAAAAEFVRFKINQPAFVYLYQVAPNGDVHLLLPNRIYTQNALQTGEYAFPESFIPSFPIGSPGVYTVVAIASVAPIIQLTPGAELFRRLGNDPNQISQGIELIIRLAGITAAQWTTTWTQYTVRSIVVTSGGLTGKTIIKVQDPTGLPIRDARFRIEQLTEDGRLLRVFQDWTDIGEGRVYYPEEGRYRVLAKRSFFFTPDPQTVCKIFKKPAGPEVTGTCEFPIQANDDLDILLRLEPVSDAADFFVSRPDLPNPYCVGRRVEFNASLSRPKDQILQYQWNFSDGSPIEARTESAISHIFRHPRVYSVTLTVLYQGNRIRSVTKNVEIVEATHPKCGPPIGQPEVVGKAKVATQSPNTINVEVRNGYVVMPVSGMSLPTNAGILRLSYQYLVTAFPYLDVQQARAFATSYVSVVFVDAQGNAIGNVPSTVYNIEPGRLPTSTSPLPQPISLTLPIPPGARDLRVYAVTSVLATIEATEDPLSIQYSNFQTTGGAVPDTCATVLSGQQLLPGQFLEKQIFRLGEVIAFRMTNNCAQSITLRADLGWWRVVDTQSGREVFRTQPTTVSIPPGQSVVASWDQRGAFGQFVDVNRIYRIEVETQGGGIYSTSVAIVFP